MACSFRWRGYDDGLVISPLAGAEDYVAQVKEEPSNHVEWFFGAFSPAEKEGDRLRKALLVAAMSILMLLACGSPSAAAPIPRTPVDDYEVMVAFEYGISYFTDGSSPQGAILLNTILVRKLEEGFKWYGLEVGTRNGQPSWMFVIGKENQDGRIREFILGNVSGFGFLVGHDYSITDRLNLILDSYLLVIVSGREWPLTVSWADYLTVRLQYKVTGSLAAYGVLDGCVSHQSGAAYNFAVSARGGLAVQF